MVSTLTERFVDCARGVRYDDLPRAAIDMAKAVALDGLGVTVAGSDEPLGLGRIVKQYVRENAGSGVATVVTGGFKASPAEAAFANGTMAHALDFDNTWYPLNHPTSPTLPAILAVAEHRGLAGKAVVEAIVVAFEVQGRLRLAAHGLETGKRFHKPGTTGLFGATAGVAKLLNLDRNQWLMAFGLAGSRAGSLSINTGTMTKSSHSGHGARMGVECAVLASMGWTAASDVFGPNGFFDAFSPGNAEPALIVEGFGAPFRMVEPGVGFKKHPSNYFTHRPIDAALALRREHNIDPADVERVEVRFPRFPYVDRPQPQTGLDGKFSVQYTTSVALLDGGVEVDSFTNERRFAADAVAMLPRVHVIFDDTIPADFDRMHVDLKVVLRDGTIFEKRVQELTGWVGFPLTREQRLDKFYRCTRRLIGEDRARAAVGLVETLEEQPDVRALMDLLRDG